MTIIGKPKQIPSRWGRLFLIPKLTPDAIIIILLGPGVILAVAANNSTARYNSIAQLFLCRVGKVFNA
jgi:hypothetical protein